MSKLWILLIGVCVAVGAYLQFTGFIDLSQYIQLPTEQIKTVITQFTKDPITFIRNNLPLIGGSATILGIGYGAISSAFNKAKKKATATIQNAEAQTTQISNDYLKLEQQKKEVDTLLETKTNETNILQQAEAKYQTNISELNSRLASMQKQRDELSNIVTFLNDKTVLQRKVSTAIH